MNVLFAEADQQVQSQLQAGTHSSEDLDKLIEASDAQAGKVISFEVSRPIAKSLSRAKASPIEIIYVNGILTLYDDFVHQLVSLFIAVEDSGAAVTTVSGFYNFSEKAVANNGVRLCLAIRRFSFSIVDYALCNVQESDFWKDFTESFDQWVEIWLKAEPTVAQVDDLLNLARTRLDAGRRIIFVGHSQGNL